MVHSLVFGRVDNLVPYDGGRDLLVKLAGATLRNRHNWRIMVTIFNKTGHNGKSTFLDHLKRIIGHDGVMTSNLALLAGGSNDAGRFALSNLVGASLITCEDSDSGAKRLLIIRRMHLSFVQPMILRRRKTRVPHGLIEISTYLSQVNLKVKVMIKPSVLSGWCQKNFVLTWHIRLW